MPQTLQKIFVSSYACEPGLGSEIGVGWHWVVEMSRYFELWVLTRESNRSRIETWKTVHPDSPVCAVHFLYYDTPYWMRFWKKGLRGVRLYYALWQQMSDTLVQQTMEREGIRVFHLLTYGNLLWPISPYGQRQCCVIGPAGGVESIPWEYACHFSRKARLREGLRRLMLKTLPYNGTFRRQVHRAARILCKSDDAYYAIPAADRAKALRFTDVAVEPLSTPAGSPSADVASDGLTHLLIVGRLDAWRGFDLAIEALAIARQQAPSLRLDIVGKGSEGATLRALVSRLGLDDVVTFSGQVSMETYYDKMRRCEAVVNPCLKEGAVTTAFDSMSLAKPLLALETGGYTRYFDDTCAILIPRTGRKEVIAQLAAGMVQLTDPVTRQRLGTAAYQRGLSYTWADKGRAIRDLFLDLFSQLEAHPQSHDKNTWRG